MWNHGVPQVQAVEKTVKIPQLLIVEKTGQIPQMPIVEKTVVFPQLQVVMKTIAFPQCQSDEKFVETLSQSRCSRAQTSERQEVFKFGAPKVRHGTNLGNSLG